MVRKKTEEPNIVEISAPVTPISPLFSNIEPARIKADIGIYYSNKEEIEAFLDISGRKVLSEIIRLTKDTASNEKWPLNKIEIDLVKDYEITNW